MGAVSAAEMDVRGVPGWACRPAQTLMAAPPVPTRTGQQVAVTQDLADAHGWVLGSLCRPPSPAFSLPFWPRSAFPAGWPPPEFCC